MAGSVRDALGSRLTIREEEVMEFVADGYTTRQIAGKLAITVSTVNTHIGRALKRAGLHRRQDLVVWYFKVYLPRTSRTSWPVQLSTAFDALAESVASGSGFRAANAVYLMLAIAATEESCVDTALMYLPQVLEEIFGPGGVEAYLAQLRVQGVLYPLDGCWYLLRRATLAEARTAAWERMTKLERQHVLGRLDRISAGLDFVVGELRATRVWLYAQTKV
jgi:DNA-binding CsgD family transcriptional regulator